MEHHIYRFRFPIPTFFTCWRPASCSYLWATYNSLLCRVYQCWGGKNMVLNSRRESGDTRFSEEWLTEFCIECWLDNSCASNTSLKVGQLTRKCIVKSCSSLDRPSETNNEVTVEGNCSFSQIMAVHTSKRTTQFLKSFKWEFLPHPSHSLDLAPSGFTFSLL